MTNNSPETPAAECLQLATEFISLPEKSGKKLADIGRKHGYHVILPTVNSLWVTCADQQHRELLAFLRQPEWVWRQLADEEDTFVAGVVQSDTGRFLAVGTYKTGEEEFTTFDLEGTGVVCNYLPGDVPDPRPRVKPRLYCKNKKYYVALVGKVAELVRAGYDRAHISLTEGKGYFGRHEAYVIKSGPLDADKAREEKISHCVAPSLKKAQ
jgi:hypothetical protein